MTARGFRATSGSSGPSFRGETTSAVAANTIINYTSQEDTHGGYSAGTYTVQVPGLYLVAVAAKQSTAVGFGLRVLLSGTQRLYSSNAPAAAFSGTSITGLVRCVAGSTISVMSNTAYTPQSDSPADTNYLHIVRVA